MLALAYDNDPYSAMALVDTSTDPRIIKRENSVSAIEGRLRSLERNKSNLKVKKRE